MKWSGQHIYDLISRFRNDVYLEGSSPSLYIGSDGTGTLSLTAGDIDWYNPVADGNPTLSFGFNADERLLIQPFYSGSSLATVFFKTRTESASAGMGKFRFNVDQVNILDIDDGGIDLDTNMGISINGTNILTDSSGTATLSNIDALDATTISTLNAALTAGDITGVTAGTNLSGGGTSGAVTINLADASTSVKGAASFSSDNFSVSSGVVIIKEEGVDLTNEVSGVLPSANMDSDTAHLTGVQTFTGRKTFEDKTTFDGNRSVTPGDGVMIHVDASDITDSNTSASGTAAKYAHVSIEAPRLLATNSSVTTTDAATLYINSNPSASTNQTITNAYALWVDAGNARFDGSYFQTAGDMTLYDAVNDGNPTISIGSSATNRLLIEAEYNSSAQTLNEINFKTSTTSSTANDGRMLFHIDDVHICAVRDDGFNLQADMGLRIAGTDIITDSSGTATLSNIDALDATTEATIESAVDTLSNLTTVGTIGTGVWQGTAIASAYLDADTAHISATKQMTHHVFVDDMGTTKQYVGLTEADAENTNTANKFLPFPAIVDGKLLKVALRSNKDLTGHTLTWRLESIGAANPNSATPDILGTQSGAGCNNTTMTTYDFTGVSTNAFDASDLVYLSIQSNTDFGSNVIYYITCLWEFDLS